MSGDRAHDPRRTVAELPDTALVLEPTTRIVLPPGCWTGGVGVGARVPDRARRVRGDTWPSR
jgi:hypothetical protein